ncbi:unnamed protein product [Cladocopium goreaui]|uniref:PPPDE domain-containing protein n=1 Tax=Cladocopium goreaui TaxID=2562237 RepID=A0A9P1G0E5_9DINO|nr:unnamed protein product [Cladocopium goreaui]
MNVVGFANLLTESFQDFQGDDYELVGHNCCSFARAMVKKLGVRSMPRWVDRLARGLNLGAFIGAKATKMAAHPVKKAAALGGRVLRMGRGDSESEDSDEDDGLCPTGVEIAEKAKDIPGQIRCGTGAQPVAQRAQPVAQPVAQVMPRHAPHVQPAMPALPTSMPGFGWQAQAGQQVAMAQVPNVALPRPDQVAAAGYPMPAPVYVAPQTYPAQADDQRRLGQDRNSLPVGCLFPYLEKASNLDPEIMHTVPKFEAFKSQRRVFIEMVHLKEHIWLCQVIRHINDDMMILHHDSNAFKIFQASLTSSFNKVVARSGEQLRSSLPISTKREVDEVDWEEKDVLGQLSFDQLLKEIRMALPSEAKAAPALELLDEDDKPMSSDELTTSFVLVHVYELESTFVRANRVLSIAGSGAYFAGVEIFGWEWSYGEHGVKKTIPRVQTRHIYKYSVFLGHSEMNVAGFANLLTESFQDFQGDDYELVGHNCCSFARAMVEKLGVRSMPRWVDRLARCAASAASGAKTCACAWSDAGATYVHVPGQALGGMLELDSKLRWPRPDQVAAAGQTNARRFKWQHNFKTTLDDLRLIGAQHFQRQEQRLQSGLQQDPGIPTWFDFQNRAMGQLTTASGTPCEPRLSHRHRSQTKGRAPLWLSSPPGVKGKHR